MSGSLNSFSERVQPVIGEFIPICRKLAGQQRYAISVGGSHGKGTWDNHSDVDFRLFTEAEIQYADTRPDLWVDYYTAIERWKQKGVVVDGVWPRTIGEIDAALDQWQSGNIEPIPMDWTIWGYHILTDIYNQAIVEDPYGVIQGWKERLKVYSPRLRQAILDKYLTMLHYWRTDYHYRHKIDRGDIIFLAGMSAKLVHEIMQILFALNETYYVGDGSNLEFAEKFKIIPPDLNGKIHRILYPPQVDAIQEQYAALMSLIDEVIGLANTSLQT